MMPKVIKRSSNSAEFQKEIPLTQFITKPLQTVTRTANIPVGILKSISHPLCGIQYGETSCGAPSRPKRGLELQPFPAFKAGYFRWTGRVVTSIRRLSFL